MNSTTADSASVTVRREIAASAEDVFDAWLDADSLAAWMRPGEILRTTAKVDARVGGAYEVIMHRAAGTILHTGTYRVIDRPRRLVFSWISPYTELQESLVTVDFHARRGRTEVVVTHERLPGTEAAAGHHEGWTLALQIFASLPWHSAAA